VFAPNSQLKEIQEEAFSRTRVSNVVIPANGSVSETAFPEQCQVEMMKSTAGAAEPRDPSAFIGTLKGFVKVKAIAKSVSLWKREFPKREVAVKEFPLIADS
jgi:hypothetical protein